MRGSMRNALILGATVWLLTGCGLADVGAAGATNAASEAEQAKQGQQIEARVKQQVDAAVQLDTQKRKAAEAESE